MEEYIGKKFNHWTIIEIAPLKKLNDGKFQKRVICKCDCGTIRNLSLNVVKRLETNCCGCIGDKQASLRWKTHGLTGTRENRIWKNMNRRCDRPTNHNYKWYGGRGISVCKEWKESFETFLKDMGKAPTNKHSIDRIDNNGNYCKENCRWATQHEQMLNTSKNKKANI